MNVFGLTIVRTKALAAQRQSVSSARGWWPIVREPFAGAWQRNEEIQIDTVTAHWAVFACVSLIASDFSKMRLRLVSQDADGIWTEDENPAWSPVLRKPNSFQIRQQFFEWWMTSKLTQGNTYALKRRDGRGVVDALYLLDPMRVAPLIAPEGDVFYELQVDALAGLTTDNGRIIVPAREIIHDRYCPLFHPLVGLPPLYACGMAALQGLKIQDSATRFFSNWAQPGGVITAPGTIPKDKADEMKARWHEGFSGDNAGMVAILGDGLQYNPMTRSAVDAQLVDQQKWTAEAVCTAYRVPPHKICVGQMPNYNNIEILDRQYYSQCLQEKIEVVEALLDDGLEIKKPYGTEFDRDDLFSMDLSTLIKSEKDAAGIKQINESRKRLNLKPVTGGETVYLQQQNYSIEALNRRDQEETAPTTPAATPAPALPPVEPRPAKGLEADALRAAVLKAVTPLATKYLPGASSAA